MLYYVLYGDAEHYSEKLARSVDSVKRWCPGLKITVLRDVECDLVVPDCVDVREVDIGCEGTTAKAGAFCRMEGDFIYLDVDTVVFGDIRQVLLLLDYAKIILPLCSTTPFSGDRVLGREFLPYHNTGFVVACEDVRPLFEDAWALCKRQGCSDEWALHQFLGSFDDLMSLPPSVQARRPEEYVEGETLVWHSHREFVDECFSTNFLGRMIEAYKTWIPTAAAAQRLTGCVENRVLEIGTHEGQSMQWFCRNLQPSKMVCVDPYNGHWGCTRKGEESLALNRWRTVAREFGTTVELVRDIEFVRDVFNIILIDGAHDEESVIRDTAVAAELIAPGGLLMWDDYSYPGVGGVVDTFVAENNCKDLGVVADIRGVLC